MKSLEEIKKRLNSLKKEVGKEYKAEIIGVFGSYVSRKQRRTSASPGKILQRSNTF